MDLYTGSLGRKLETRHLRRVARRVLAEEALMPAKQLERLRLVPELDPPDEFSFSVPAREVPLHDFDRRDARGQVVG